MFCQMVIIYKILELNNDKSILILIRCSTQAMILPGAHNLQSVSQNIQIIFQINGDNIIKLPTE